MPERVLISLEDAVLQFGGKPLFDGLTMHITEGEKICLVGKNGAGKTTLMRLILGELELDGGTRFALPGIRLGYLAQQVAHDKDDSVHAFVLSGLPLEEQTDDQHYLADMIIAPLGLSPEATMGTLSGGQLRRAALARSLIEAPDLLLLDEPTNHLDLQAIQWLEDYLAAYRGALLCVSHDRAFLAAISRKVFWLDRGQIKTCPFGYAGFEEWMETQVAQEARELANQQKKLQAEEGWMHGGVSGRRKRNQRRLGELRRLREKLKSDKALHKSRHARIELDGLSTVQASKIIVEFKEVSKSFTRDGTTLPILNDFHLRILRGDRIGIIGKNGSGKSTFLKLLTGEMTPDEGRVARGKTIEVSYFDQTRSGLNPKKSLWDTLCPDGGDHVFLGADRERPRHVCGYLKDFLFDPKIARDLVSTLSGGQQNRLMLAQLLASPGNVLILDEPTNDLDMDTLDMLQDMLADYPGTLLLVSHDRDFLDRTVTEILSFEGDGVVESHIGGYSDYLATKQSRAQMAKTPAKASTVNTKKSSSAKSLNGKERHELEKLPAQIEALTQELAALRIQLDDANFYTRDAGGFDTATTRYGEAETELNAAETRWLALEEKRIGNI